MFFFLNDFRSSKQIDLVNLNFLFLDMYFSGGTFALYSLICRYAKVGLTPSQEVEDREVSTFQLELPNKPMQRASKLQSKLESSNFAKYVLLFATMLGTSMVIGDGVLTPCISGTFNSFSFLLIYIIV